MIHTTALQQCSALPRIFGFYIFFGSFFVFLLGDITYQSASRDLSKKLSQQFSTQRKNIKQNVKFGSHIFYPFPTRNTNKSLTTYNVCNNTEINIKKRCYNTQVYTQHQQLFNHSFFYQRKCFSSKLAMTIVIFP